MFFFLFLKRTQICPQKFYTNSSLKIFLFIFTSLVCFFVCLQSNWADRGVHPYCFCFVHHLLEGVPKRCKITSLFYIKCKPGRIVTIGAVRIAVDDARAGRITVVATATHDNSTARVDRLCCPFK